MNSTRSLHDLSVLPKKDIQNVENNVNNETNSLLEESLTLSPSTTDTHTHTVHSTQYSTSTVRVQKKDDNRMDIHPSILLSEREGEEAEVMAVLHRKWRLS